MTGLVERVREGLESPELEDYEDAKAALAELDDLLATFADRAEEVKRALTASGVRPDLRDDLISLLARYEAAVTTEKGDA